MQLEKPRIIRNVDGTRNSLGSVTHAAKLEVSYGTHKEEQDFFIINLGGDEMLLGYPFLRFTNPPIDWQKGTFYGNVHIATKDAYLWNQERQDEHQRSYNPEQYKDEEHDPEFILNNELGIVHYPKKYLRKTTMATELAVQAADKRERTWQEQVPRYYYKYGKVFSEIHSNRFPKSRPWDHAIDLVKERPEALPGHIIPLAPIEQEALDKFLKEHLAKGYIQ